MTKRQASQLFLAAVISAGALVFHAHHLTPGGGETSIAPGYFWEAAKNER